MTAVLLNVGSGIPIIKPAKLYMCTQKHYKHDKDACTALGVCGNGPLSYSGNVVTRIGLYTHTEIKVTDRNSFSRREAKRHQSLESISLSLK